MIDTSRWKEFRINDLFRLKPTKGKDSTELVQGNDISYIGAKKDGNGLMMRCQLEGFEDWVSKGNCIVFISLGAGSAGYATYQPEDFIGMNGKTICGYNKNLNELTGNFLTVVLGMERPKYSFGRSWTGKRLKETKIKLPATPNGDPDWKWMENFIKKLHYRPITTEINNNQHIPLNIEEWGQFRLGELFTVKYGVNLELTNLEICDPSDKEAVAFVSRTESNNGVSAYVKYLPDIRPQPAHTLTVAAGGSVLSTFLQTEPFYSGRDLYLLINNSISDECRLFVKTVIEQNKFRFNYGRQANKHLNDLLLKLPVTPSGDPDWKWMEDYIKSLPYSDRISTN